VEKRELPLEMHEKDYNEDEEEEEEEDPKIEDFKERLKLLLASLEDQMIKAESLIDCWDRLRNDMASLTEAVR